MDKIIALSKEDLIRVNGGEEKTFMQKLGYAVGAYCADFCDFWKGIGDSIFG